MPKISDALMETYLWLSGYEDETQGPCASRCIIDAAAKFARAVSRNDRRPISGHQLKIDSPPASPLTQPGHISGTGAVGTTVNKGTYLSSPPVITNTGCAADPIFVRSVVLAGVGRGGEHTSSYLGIQTCWVYVWEEIV